MSLTDALLLESWPHNANAAALFPCNYWIAQRGDGLFGSGASGDPWDGSGSRFDARMKDIQTRMEQMQIGQTLKIGDKPEWPVV